MQPHERSVSLLIRYVRAKPMPLRAHPGRLVGQPASHCQFAAVAPFGLVSSRQPGGGSLLCRLRRAQWGAHAILSFWAMPHSLSATVSRRHLNRLQTPPTALRASRTRFSASVMSCQCQGTVQTGCTLSHDARGRVLRCLRASPAHAWYTSLVHSDARERL